MAELKLEPVWTLKITSRELTLIRAALGNRLKPEQFNEASTLDRDLAERTVQESKNRLTETAKLEKNLKG